MTLRFVETEQERATLIRFIGQQKLPLAVTIERGSRRTVKQNRLGRLWFNEIAEQRDDTSAEEVRGYCKLTFGVPILRAENEKFCAAYDKHVKGLPYETKIAMMMEPLDFPVTRLMTTKQHTAYLDSVHRHFTEQGIALTDPGDLLFQADVKALT